MDARNCFENFLKSTQILFKTPFQKSVDCKSKGCNDFVDIRIENKPRSPLRFVIQTILQECTLNMFSS